MVLYSVTGGPGGSSTISSASGGPSSSAGGPSGSAILRFLGDQLLVRQRLASNESKDRVAEQERVVAVVPAKRGLIEVPGQVLFGELVVAADYGAVEQAPDGLDGVCMNLPVDPFVTGMIDPGVDGRLVDVLYDPQTSGGLLIASDRAAADPLARRLEAAGVQAWRIGRVEAPSTDKIRVKT